MQTSDPRQIWTLKEAKAHLSQILSLVEVEGPQYICADQPDDQDSQKRKAFVVVPADVWQKKNAPESNSLRSTWASG